MITQIQGQLEIDHFRGVIYFHTTDPKVCNDYGTVTVLRICNLPKPIPKRCHIDLTHKVGVSYVKKTTKKRKVLEDNL